VADVRLSRSPSFNISLKRDIFLLAAWLAECSEYQRACFVSAGYDRRFIGYPISSFDKQAYNITNTLIAAAPQYAGVNSSYFAGFLAVNPPYCRGLEKRTRSRAGGGKLRQRGNKRLHKRQADFFRKASQYKTPKHTIRGTRVRSTSRPPKERREPRPPLFFLAFPFHTGVAKGAMGLMFTLSRLQAASLFVVYIYLGDCRLQGPRNIHRGSRGAITQGAALARKLPSRCSPVTDTNFTIYCASTPHFISSDEVRDLQSLISCGTRTTGSFAARE
jgi:hypothetical protein